jgi:hypothetical protein
MGHWQSWESSWRICQKFIQGSRNNKKTLQTNAPSLLCLSRSGCVCPEGAQAVEPAQCMYLMNRCPAADAAGHLCPNVSAH